MYLDKPIDIEKLYVSVFITSTFNQCINLIPNYEDGLFSRFIFYILLPKGYKNVFKNNSKYKLLTDEIDTMADLVLEMATEQASLNECIFHLTKVQQEHLMGQGQ